MTVESRGGGAVGEQRKRMLGNSTPLLVRGKYWLTRGSRVGYSGPKAGWVVSSPAMTFGRVCRTKPVVYNVVGFGCGRPILRPERRLWN